jgi:hypothetical protein
MLQEKPPPRVSSQKNVNFASVLMIQNWKKNNFDQKIALYVSLRIHKGCPSQCGGSGMFIPILDLDFYPSRIPDPKTATKEKGEKKIVVKPFFVATNFTKLKIIIFLKC